MMNNKSEIKSRDIYIDILRILCCLMVIFNHTKWRGFDKIFYISGGGTLYLVNNVCSILCKVAVPIFFMISGVYLLKKEESLIDTYKRLPKIIINIILFSFIYCSLDSYLIDQAFSLKKILKTIISTGYWHLWYLYAYIALIITLPFFRKFVKGLDLKTSIYMIFIAFLYMVFVPIINHFLIPLNNYVIPSWITINIFIYPIIGYILGNIVEIDKIKYSHLFILWIAVIIGIIISFICQYNYSLDNPGSISETFLTNFCILNAITIFLTIKKIFINKHYNQTLIKVIGETGKCTFGIYLIHNIFLWKVPILYNFWLKLEGGTIGSHIGIFISCILIFFISGIITYILRKIPIIKKIF